MLIIILLDYHTSHIILSFVNFINFVTFGDLVINLRNFFFFDLIICISRDHTNLINQ